MVKRTYKDALLGIKRRRKRCPNGSRRNLKTNKCQNKKRRLRSNSKRTRRCPNGSRRIPAKTGQCIRKKRKSSRKSSRRSSRRSRSNR